MFNSSEQILRDTDYGFRAMTQPEPRPTKDGTCPHCGNPPVRAINDMKLTSTLHILGGDILCCHCLKPLKVEMTVVTISPRKEPA